MTLLNGLKSIFCAIGHPILFLIFLVFLAEGSFGANNPRFFNIPLFFEVSTNVYRLNAWIYIPYALISYGGWLAIQFGILHLIRRFSLEDYLSKKFSEFYLLLCGSGYVNLCFWIIGMEGNIFGFIFALPLLLVSTALTFMELKIFFQRPN